jgi:hypothetical protein
MPRASAVGLISSVRERLNRQLTTFTCLPVIVAVRIGPTVILRRRVGRRMVARRMEYIAAVRGVEQRMGHVSRSHDLIRSGSALWIQQSRRVAGVGIRNRRRRHQRRTACRRATGLESIRNGRAAGRRRRRTKRRSSHFRLAIHLRRGHLRRCHCRLRHIRRSIHGWLRSV